MSLSSATSRNDYTGTGLLDEYDYTFRIFAETDLLVTQRDDEGVETTLDLEDDYTVDGVGDSGGGTITLVAGALASDYTLSIRRVRPLTQETDIRNQGSFFPETHEDAFDHAMMVDQQQQDEIDRTIKIAETLDPADFDLTLGADVADQAGRSIIVNEDGDGFEWGPTSDEIESAQGYAEAAQAAALTAIGESIDLNVVENGALGNGTADDHDAIQDTLDAAGALGGATVVLPPGTYRVASQLVWPDASDVAMRGSGIGATIIKFDFGGSPSTTPGIVIDSATSMSNVKISDMTLQGAANDDTAIYDLVEVQDNVSDIRFERLECKWARVAGLRFTSGSPGERVWVKDCYFHDINSSAMTGASGGAILGNFNKMHVVGNTFKDVGNDGGFHAFYPTSAGGREDVLVADNVFSGTHARCHFFGVANTRVSVVNNVFKTGGLVFQAVINGVVSGNTFYDCPLSLISDGALIQGNMFLFTASTTTTNMIVNGGSCSRVVIANNIFDDQSSIADNLGINVTHVDTEDFTIRGNTFFNQTYPIWVKGDNHVIQGNRISTASTGEIIYLREGNGHVVVDNIIECGSGGRAVWNESSGIATIKGNTLIGGGTEGGTAATVVATGQPYITSGVRVRTTSYTASGNDGVIVGNPTGGNITITLPAASGGTGAIGRDKVYIIKNIHASNSVIVDGDGSETIDGATTKTITTQYGFLQIVADSANARWHIISSGGTIT